MARRACLGSPRRGAGGNNWYEPGTCMVVGDLDDSYIVLQCFNFLFLFQEIIPMLQSKFPCPFGLRVRGAYPPLCPLWLKFGFFA
jgi:hypothetical protein